MGSSTIAITIVDLKCFPEARRHVRANKSRNGNGRRNTTPIWNAVAALTINDKLFGRDGSTATTAVTWSIRLIAETSLWWSPTYYSRIWITTITLNQHFQACRDNTFWSVSIIIDSSFWRYFWLITSIIVIEFDGRTYLNCGCLLWIIRIRNLTIITTTFNIVWCLARYKLVRSTSWGLNYAFWKLAFSRSWNWFRSIWHECRCFSHIFDPIDITIRSQATNSTTRRSVRLNLTSINQSIWIIRSSISITLSIVEHLIIRLKASHIDWDTNFLLAATFRRIRRLTALNVQYLAFNSTECFWSDTPIGRRTTAITIGYVQSFWLVTRSVGSCSIINVVIHDESLW